MASQAESHEIAIAIVAQHAVDTGEVAEVRRLLTEELESEVSLRFARVAEMSVLGDGSESRVQEYREAMADFVAWTARVHSCVTSETIAS